MHHCCTYCTSELYTEPCLHEHSILPQEPGSAPTPAPAPAPAPKPPAEDDALDDSKFDEFMGSDAGAFATFGEYDQVHMACQ